MGMYDTLNGEQVKIFYIAHAMLPDDFIMDGCISYSGGDLRNYDKGDEVPYRTLYYNLGKDFNIYDLKPYDHDEPIIHIIRNGINLGVKTLDEMKSSDFDVRGFSDHGIELKFSSVDDIKTYLEEDEKCSQYFYQKKKEARDAYFNYLKGHKDEEFEMTDEFKQLYINYRLEMIENDKLFRNIAKKRTEFVIGDPMRNEFCSFGAIVYGLLHPIYLKVFDENYTLTNDERLEYVVVYNTLLKYLEKGDSFLKEYFNFMDFNSNDIKDFYEKLDKLKNVYEKMIKYRINTDRISEMYFLNDVLSGRHKDFYLEYNIEPFVGFDYDTWNYFKKEKSNSDDFEEIFKEYLEKNGDNSYNI